jgi:hypothetical protein
VREKRHELSAVLAPPFRESNFGPYKARKQAKVIEFKWKSIVLKVFKYDNPSGLIM